MRLHLIAVGTRMPAWVRQACEEFQGRLPPEFKCTLREITPVKKNKTISREQVLREEAIQINSVLPGRAPVVALDERGTAWTSVQLSNHLDRWLQTARELSFVIGGSEGLASEITTHATHIWSLSALTLPHALVRVVVLEQIYRAWTILQKHPYHRGE